MNLALMTLGGLALAGTYMGFKKKDPTMNIGSCFFDKLATPLYTLFNEYHSNSLFLIDSIEEDCIICNTPYERLYGIELSSNSNLTNYLRSEKLSEIIRDNKDSEDSFFYYVLLKQAKFQKQYLFSHNPIIIKTLADNYGVSLLSGVELVNVLYNLYLQNSFYVEDKQIKPSLKIEQDTKTDEPCFMSFKRLARQAIRKNYKDISIFQGFKHLDIKEANIAGIFKLNFTGSIWISIDLSTRHINNHISRLINYSKIVGDKKPFVDLQNSYKNKEFDLALINITAFLKDYDEQIIGSLGSALKTSFIAKELFKSQHLQKNPLKFKDSEFNFLVKSDYLHNFIATTHKKTTKEPDIYGVDKNGSFINYSFANENFNPHSCIIAKSGSGKSVSKQKIMAQLIGLNFENGECSNLGKKAGQFRIRSYDIGFSDENFVKLIKNNPNNSIAHIESDFYSFSYNILNLDRTNLQTFEEDLVFNMDLVSIILETQNSEALNLNEQAFFKSLTKKLYQSKEYQRYRVRDLKNTHKELYEKLLLDYNESTFLQDLKEEEFDFLKTPLLIDLVKMASKESQNMQIKEEDRKDYASLARKLDGVEKLELFSNFDKIDIKDRDFISMDLNNFKESSLFVPIFLSIFQKTYYKDREYALKLKRENKVRPKLFYAIEEAKNFFRVPYFTIMYDKLAREARKYNVHLCFITQNAEDIPKATLKNLDTRIMLLSPEKKLETIEETKQALDIPKNVEIGLINTEQFEMCVWYSKGVFHMKFEITPKEMEVFSTNPNE
ncbi:hypothetical protein [Campylobacter helveticus]|uniref:hypothetical protein n=1 Tax=Campylobacter helveticus TaxID=28898 RepID=UPI002149C8B0|nr:hypothetical protein [Campylobacter helveticus]MCR2066161.1 hypothetical protein [Campylobacter helveticus]